MRIQAHGLAVESAQPVDARIYRRESVNGDETQPIVHLCTTAMPEDRGDFGSGAVDRLGPEDVFVGLIEYSAAETDAALFRAEGRPRTLNPDDFSSQALQRVQANQSGCQYWFREGGRPFCLYVVLGSHANRRRLIPTAEQMIASLRVESGDEPEPAPTRSLKTLPRNSFRHP